MYLRMGRASDLNPCTMLNAVARKRLPGGLEYKDSLLPQAVPRVSCFCKWYFYKDVSLSIAFSRRKSWHKQWKNLACKYLTLYNPVSNPMEEEDMPRHLNR